MSRCNTFPVAVATGSRKKKAHKNISPNNITLDSGTATMFVNRNSRGSW
jgi:hypothetical protein